MSTKLYVGNIPFSTTSQDLQTLFSAHGSVVQVELVSDRFTGRSRGFAFVEMAYRHQGLLQAETVRLAPLPRERVRP
jgi:RNA recognition motif-containing protein